MWGKLIKHHCAVLSAWRDSLTHGVHLAMASLETWPREDPHPWEPRRPTYQQETCPTWRRSPSMSRYGLHFSLRMSTYMYSCSLNSIKLVFVMPLMQNNFLRILFWNMLFIWSPPWQVLRTTNFQISSEYLFSMQGHALFTRQAGGANPCPLVDFVGGFNAFFARAYGLPGTIEQTYGQAFNPFLNDQNYFLSVVTLEELGATGISALHLYNRSGFFRNTKDFCSCTHQFANYQINAIFRQDQF